MTSQSGLEQGPSVMLVSGEPGTAGHRYRVEHTAAALSASGLTSRIVSVRDVGGCLRSLESVVALWIWRAPCSRGVDRLLRECRSRGIVSIFDIDDLLFLPEIATSDLIDGNRHLGPLQKVAVRRQYAGLQKSLLLSDHCAAPTEALARQIRSLGKPATVIPNGFDDRYFQASRLAVRRRRASSETGIVRIGYAAGTRTHQRDLSVAVPGLARVLAEHPHARFVTFGEAVDVDAFSELRALAPQLELRRLVSFDDLPSEYARFDINIAPLEVGNPFCEAKSELKFFEAALAGAATVASPTETFSTAIRHCETGFLARDEDSWYELLSALVIDESLRERLASDAYDEVVRLYGPERRAELVQGLLLRPTAARETARRGPPVAR